MQGKKSLYLEVFLIHREKKKHPLQSPWLLLGGWLILGGFYWEGALYFEIVHYSEGSLLGGNTV